MLAHLKISEKYILHLWRCRGSVSPWLATKQGANNVDNAMLLNKEKPFSYYVFFLNQPEKYKQHILRNASCIYFVSTSRITVTRQKAGSQQCRQCNATESKNYKFHNVYFSGINQRNEKYFLRLFCVKVQCHGDPRRSLEPAMQTKSVPMAVFVPKMRTRLQTKHSDRKSRCQSWDKFVQSENFNVLSLSVTRLWTYKFVSGNFLFQI